MDGPNLAGEESVRPDAQTRLAANLLRRSVRRLTRRLRGERADHGVSASKLNVLGHLRRAGPLTATELAVLEHVQPQSLTRLLVSLEEAGLIAREPAEIDRRQIRIEITQTGRDLLLTDARQQDAWLSRAMDATLTAEERDILTIAARLLDRLSDQKPMREREE